MTEARNVFTYGSLMFPVVWDRVVKGRYRSSEATVHGFQRLRIRNEHYPALIINANASALTGRVYYGVSAEDIVRLDHFETGDYARVSIAVTVAGKAIAADAYLTLKPESLDHEEWSPDIFEKDGLDAFLATYAVTNTPPK
ncbi:MAG: gamma-glutamylcyclotransferase family protein [Casimicrobium sp.]